MNVRYYLPLFLMLSSTVVSDDRISIDLRGGARVTGTVLTEKPDALFVDLGHDVVRLPKEQILKRQKFTGSEVASTTASATVSEDDMDGFYKTGGMDGKSVRQLVDQFGEGVISIDTPSGKGPDFYLTATDMRSRISMSSLAKLEFLQRFIKRIHREPSSGSGLKRSRFWR